MVKKFFCFAAGAMLFCGCSNVIDRDTVADYAPPAEAVAMRDSAACAPSLQTSCRTRYPSAHRNHSGNRAPTAAWKEVPQNGLFQISFFITPCRAARS